MERLDNATNLINELKGTNASIAENNKKLKEDYEELQDYIFDLDCRIIQTEQYSRRESIVIKGIPDKIYQKDLEKTVINVLHEIGLKEISSYDITACHRLFKNNSDKFPAKTVVCFTNRKMVEFCLQNRNSFTVVKNLLKMNIRFHESLCQANGITKECVILKKNKLIKDYFIHNGFIKIIKKEGDRPFKIKHPDILNDIFCDFHNH